jgi:hypothetical protein
MTDPILWKSSRIIKQVSLKKWIWSFSAVMKWSNSFIVFQILLTNGHQQILGKNSDHISKTI